MSVLKSRLKRAIKTMLGKEPGIFLDGDFLIRYVAKCIPADSVFIEVGAFTGRTGYQFRELAGLQAQNCHLIEACPTNYEIMKKICPGFRLHNLAISDGEGVLPFYVVDTPRDEGTSRSNSFDRKHLEDRFGKENVKEIKIRSVNLNTFFQNNNIAKVDFLFFNCEGAEYKILKGNINFLKKVDYFYLDLHHRTGNRKLLKQEQHRIYEAVLNQGFLRIGGHLREHIDQSNNHLTFLWKKIIPPQTN